MIEFFVSLIKGNIFIMSAILISKELHTVTSMVIFNLSLADLMTSLSSGIFALLGLFAWYI